MALAAVFVLALAARGAHYWAQARSNPLYAAPIMDEQKHHQWARLVAAGEGLGPRPYFRAPLYYYLLGGLYALAGPNIALARLLGCVLGAASCCLLARLGTLLGGLRTGLLAGLLAAVYWPLLWFDALLLTVGLEIFLNLLLLLVLLAAGRRASLPLFLTAGMLWGLSAITRPNILALAPGLALWLWLAAPLARRPLRRLPAAALLALGAALAILPVTIRNRVVGGEWVLIATNGGVNFYIGNNPHSDGSTAIVPGTRASWDGGYEDTHRFAEQALGRPLRESEISRYWAGQAWRWIRAEPLTWLGLMLHKLRLLFSPGEIPNNQPIAFFIERAPLAPLYRVGFPLVACLAAAGLVAVLAAATGRAAPATVPAGAAGRRRPAGPSGAAPGASACGRLWALPLLYAVIYSGTVVLFFCPARYRLPVVPVLILLAAAGLAALPDWWRQRRWGWLAGSAGVAAAMAGVLILNRPGPDFARKEAGWGHQTLGSYYARLAGQEPAHRETALLHLRAAARLLPNDPEMQLSLGYWLARFGQAAEAGEYLARAVALRPEHAEARTHYGQWLQDAGRPAEALEQFRVAAGLEPWSAEARLRLGMALTVLERHDEAVAALRAALELDPALARARHQLGLTLASSGQLEAALAEFERVRAEAPAYEAVLPDLASALARLGRYEAAAVHYRAALRAAPGSAALAQGLAAALWKAGHAAEAQETLRAALRSAPDDVGLLGDLAGMLVTAEDAGLRNAAEAVELAERAMRLSPRPGLTLTSTLAAAYAAGGRFDRAIAVLEPVVRAAHAAGQADVARRLEARLEAYRQGRAAPDGP